MTALDHPIILCHDCGVPHVLPPALPGHRAECRRCGAVLRHFRTGGLEHGTALAIASAILFVTANLFPILTFELEGRAQTATLLSGSVALWNGGYEVLGALVFFVLFLAPLAQVLGTLYVVMPLAAGRTAAPGAAWIFRTVGRLRRWAMAEVFLLGLIVAYVKLSDLAELEVGPSLAALVAFILVQVWGQATLSPFEVWERIAPQTRVAQTAGADPERLTACHDCRQVVAGTANGDGGGDCPRCGAGLHRRKPDSLRRSWALICAATILYIPANLLPIMTVVYFGAGQPDTILSGVEALIVAEMWPVALLVFFASITVPVLKLIGLVYLLVTVQRRSPERQRDRTRLYRMIEGVGRWSMVDIFMISLLAALVQLGAIATIHAELGAVAFAAVVVITMLASESFDPRLIWDAARRQDSSHD
ncbi:paraquat-inducible protein A [Roseomonas genomospecies 6]|uniref:Paraquat-inducible protein A n=1 Tax=Roseomonas genomospecies 6 TaxID=214106 RepID=A0A9W7NEN8_9PROT|nr:paraquat-inducible protein A [Roseomonas genomospecies 6]KAA0677827.1 paraquat-inducible protein A [Roseomonas genomospecies 6]